MKSCLERCDMKEWQRFGKFARPVRFHATCFLVFKDLLIKQIQVDDWAKQI